MKTKLLLLSTAMAFSVSTVPTAATADILAIGSNAKVLQNADAPQPGTSMQEVSNKFGPAHHIKTSKGKVTKHNPKITRWDYDKLSVYFENSHVIHSVVHK